jgi:hypothetical protein
MRTSNRIFRSIMISNEKVIHYKVVYLIEIYKFGFGYFFIQVRSNNSKNLNSKMLEFQKEFWYHK